MGITGTRSQEIADSVETAITGGELATGTPLPPIRDLAVDLGVNPNTVAAAYRTLRERGLIETAGRRGTRVRAQAASAHRDVRPSAVPAGARDLATGNPDVRLLPDLGAALAAVAGARSGAHRLYGDPPISPALAAAAHEIFAADGDGGGDVAVTSGALDGIDRALRCSLRPGDAVAVEDPGWPSLYDLLASLGLKRLPVRVDDDGPLPEDAAAALRAGARALLLTSRAQNPSGGALGEARAAELRALLAPHPRTLTIEDDHGFGLTDLPFCRVGGATRQWVVVRSAAKSFGPDLRLAVVAGDGATIDRMRTGQRMGPGWVSHVLQEAFAELWRRGAVDVAAVARSYALRRDALTARLAEHGVAAAGRSGVNVWVPVADEAAATADLLARGWAVTPGAPFRLGSPPGLRVTVSALDTPEIPGLAADIAAAVQAPSAPPV
ncbi:GntR family transcriptional regulator [Murinocardiopsis flavida]|uniref:GntR family transcriptional regulator n=1 Tax=Murinocardiopsis flavida TaxID=645275 RepID=A0A2P8DMW8_9ACTN|nr:aminotransferase class I/II-fold pyridoxal phosphate-dependent enzyme [Murinocardiopsis flavida]PSK98539.1 GntR family transcriptional regulator [Murinocardiopsis flavida]